jgi:hypothetical protein
MSESERPKETVILVHGTWAQPVEGKHQWYQRAEGPAAEQSFVMKLDDALARHGSGARCWAHCDADNGPFHWSGDNNWLARTAGAASLSTYMSDLALKGWKFHVVAHSHGGNVLIEALSNEIGIFPRSSSHFIGKLATLGTPFIDTISSVGRSRRRWQIFLAMPAFFFYGIALLFLGSFINHANSL